MRRAAKVDIGSQAICQGLRDRGCDVVVIGRPVDVLVGFRRQNYLFELKAANARPRTDQPKQDQFLRDWRGQVARIRTLDEALKVIGV